MNQLATLKTDVFDKVQSMVSACAAEGTINLPADYSVGNAMKSAWLKLQEVTDRNNKPVLEVCSKVSIINALQEMCYQGLNPAKNQCYFIAYGNKLVLQRSYFGSMHVAKTVDPTITEITYDVVYAEDEFEYEKKRGKTRIVTHRQKLQNVKKSNIVAAYCSIWRGDEETTTIMTFEEIKAAWAKSQIKPVLESGEIKPNSTHGQYTADMSIKTVVNKACKYVINSSSDRTLVNAFENTAEGQVEQEISENANKIYVDIEDEPAEKAPEAEAAEAPSFPEGGPDF